MRTRTIGWVLLTWGLGALPSLWAADMFTPGAPGGSYSRPGKVFTRFRAEQIKDVLNGLNVQFRTETTKSGRPVWLFDLGRFKTSLEVYDSTNLRDGTYNALSLRAGWQSPPVDRAALLERVNNWNLSRRFTTAILTPDGPDLTLDVPLGGGVTPGVLREQIELFRSAMAAYNDTVAR